MPPWRVHVIVSGAEAELLDAASMGDVEDGASAQDGASVAIRASTSQRKRCRVLIMPSAAARDTDETSPSTAGL